MVNESELWDVEERSFWVDEFAGQFHMSRVIGVQGRFLEASRGCDYRYAVPGQTSPVR